MGIVPFKLDKEFNTTEVNMINIAMQEIFSFFMIQLYCDIFIMTFYCYLCHASYTNSTKAGPPGLNYQSFVGSPC